MTEEVPDDALVERSRTGDADAFEILVRRHQRQVYLLCYRLVRNHEDAAELAQDTFVRAHRALASFRGQSAISTWLYRIAVNACLNRLALKPQQPLRLDVASDPPSTAEGAEAKVLRGEQAARVRRAIARLPDKQRATLILRAYHELSHDEVAQVLGTSTGASKANFFHALRRLRELMTEER